MAWYNWITKIGENVLKGFDKIMYDWLELLNTDLGYLIHVGTVLSTDTAETLVLSGIGGTNYRNTNLQGSFTSKTADAINKMYEYIKEPNISGIVIHAESEDFSREVETSEKLVLSVEGNSSEDTTRKKYVVDNAVPKLREWNISGYLITSSIMARELIIKDDLILKSMVLDSYAKSRLPVLYKTSDCRFYKVLISHYKCSYDPKATNAMKIDISLREYQTANVTGSNTSKYTIRAIKRT